MNKKRSICIALGCMLMFYSCGDKKQEVLGEKYKTIRVSKNDKVLQTDYPVTLKGRQAVEVRPQVSGVITRVCINEGDLVRKGQLLFVIDQVPYKAALQTAQANLRSAQAKLQTAKLNTQSREQLYKEKVVSDFDRQTANNQLLEAEAAVAQANAEVTRAKNDLSYTEVKSPVDGVASMIPYRVGALVNSSITEPLVTVSDDDQIYAYFSMTESQIIDLIQQYGSLEEVKKKMPAVTLTMSNGKQYMEEGRIDAISGIVDKGTGAVSLRASFPNKSHILRNGGTGKISVPTTHNNSIVIPKTATYELQNRVFAWKVVNGKTQSAPLTVYKYDDGQSYIVLSGLNEGDVIIADGAGLMREGMVVDTTHVSK